MRQYLNLLKAIKENGTWKEPAREGMPRTLSLFGHQMRFNLQEGFPLVTTKKVSFKNIVLELLWIISGNTNIKYLVDNGCNIWNEDAYNYYIKLMKNKYPDKPHLIHTYDRFLMYLINNISNNQLENYKWGDCGKQYGWLWRSWKHSEGCLGFDGNDKNVDQLKELINGLKNNPMSRRHIITAWNPATLDDMALNTCHAFVQFNCRPLSDRERVRLYGKVMSGKASRLLGDFKDINNDSTFFLPKEHTEYLDEYNIPKYYLDCKFTMRSNDAVLGNCYNVASYALLTHIIAEVCNMEVGDLIADLGDVHIYESHLPAVEEQLQREPRELPKLNINTEFWKTESDVCGVGLIDSDSFINNLKNDYFLRCLLEEDIQLSNYNPHPKLENETKLFTGLK